jgi:hypothetical protein
MWKTEHSNRQKKRQSTKDKMELLLPVNTEQEKNGLYLVATEDGDGDDEKRITLLSCNLICYNIVYSGTCSLTFRRKLIFTYGNKKS